MICWAAGNHKGSAPAEGSTGVLLNFAHRGGNASARRPCREGGSASALDSAPAAPGGSTAEPGCMMEFEHYFKSFHILD
ncbi:Hypothetical predicted protein [Marmota monax]|uniref:Uncharacterized protein n=1 Tax=Marmota monax TaxID=9995 RepID=A0A5E4CL58_MARMO|nr:Hypothetical predicted protein [Marmota monax]